MYYEYVLSYIENGTFGKSHTILPIISVKPTVLG